MRVPRIFTTHTLNINSECVLEESPSHHILKVLRMDVGRELILFNGQGGEYKASIYTKSKKNATVVIHSFDDIDNQSPLHSHLAIGLSRGERFEWAIQKATELGVSEITPLFTERTEVKISGERLDKKIISWQKIIIAACEQSGRNRLPILNPPRAYNELIQSDLPGVKCVLHHRNTHSLSEFKHTNACVLIVGPEGGLTDDEISTAHNNDYIALNLGPRILRTETAPLAALSLMQLAWGDF